MEMEHSLKNVMSKLDQKLTARISNLKSPQRLELQKRNKIRNPRPSVSFK